MQLAAGGSNRNQDEKIVLLFPDRNCILGTGLATLKTTRDILAAPARFFPPASKSCVIAHARLTEVGTRMPTAFAARPARGNWPRQPLSYWPAMILGVMRPM
jgi:hypothetical protein